MNPMKILMLSLVVSLIAQNATASLDWSSVKGQDSWVKVTIQNQTEADVTTSAFRVNQQEVRLDQLPADVSRELELTSQNNFNDTGYRKWKRECTVVEDYTPYVIAANNQFEVTGALQLLRYDPRVWGLEGTKQLVRILNQPEIQSLEIGIDLSPGAVSRQVRNQNPQVTASLLNQQLQQQFKLSGPGDLERVTFDLTGLDALACDIANGHARIKVRAHYAFESAKATPDIQISASDIERLHGAARLREQIGDQRDIRIASSSAILLQTLQEQWPRLTPDDHVQKTVQLLPGLIESRQAEWRNQLSRQEYVGLMHQISKWKFSRMSGYTDYILKTK